MTRLLKLALLLALVLGGLTPATGAAAPASPPSAQPAPVRDQYIITLKPGISARAFAQDSGIAAIYVYDKALNGFTARLSLRQLDALRRNPAVLGIEADRVVQAAPRNTTDEVSTLAVPWNLDRIDQAGLPLNGSYVTGSQGQSAHVYVIDTGIQSSNPEVIGRVFPAFDAFGGNGEDCNGSGTFLAGIVGGTNYGVAKQTKLWKVRVFDCNGTGTTAGLIGGINWVMVNHQPKAIALLAFGGGSSAALNAALNAMMNSNVATVAPSASGNSCASPPGNIAAILTVAAANASTASSTTYGSCIDLFAPGISVPGPSLTGGVMTRSGAPIAAAHVAGVAALFKHAYGEQSPATVHSWIVGNATPSLTPPIPPGAPNKYLYTAGL